MWGLAARVRGLLDRGEVQEALETVQNARNQGCWFRFHQWNLLGVCQARAGYLGEARATFRFVLSSWPNSAKIFNNLGNLYLLENRPQMARDCYRKAVLANVWLAAPHFNLTLACLEIGHVEEALDAYRNYVGVYRAARLSKGLGWALLTLLAFGFTRMNC